MGAVGEGQAPPETRAADRPVLRADPGLTPCRGTLQTLAHVQLRLVEQLSIYPWPRVP
jgi:hypothetical protein